MSIPARRASAAVSTTIEAPVSKISVVRVPLICAVTANPPSSLWPTMASPPLPTTGSDGISSAVMRSMKSPAS